MFDTIIAIIQLVLMSIVLGLLTNILWSERRFRDWSYYLACVFVVFGWMVVFGISFAAVTYTP